MADSTFFAGYCGKEKKTEVESFILFQLTVQTVSEWMAPPHFRCPVPTLEHWLFTMQLPEAVWTVSNYWWNLHQNSGEEGRRLLKLSSAENVNFS